MKILHLIDAFDGDSSARQLQLLGPRLHQSDSQVEVCCLGPDTPALHALRQSGVIVHALQWTRWFDPSVLRNVRAVMHEASPDVIHVWSLPALRVLGLVARRMLARVVVSASLPAQGQLAWWDHWLLQQVRCVALGGDSDPIPGLRNGFASPLLRVIAPAVALDHAVRTSANSRNIVYLGRIDRTDGARHAVWAFDILRHRFPEARLQMIGAESDSTPVRGLADGLEVSPFVQYLGNRENRAPFLRDASAVWLPRMRNHGREAALEAMAHARVVIGSDVPCLREVIRDHETGFLVPVGSVMDMARRTARLFQDEALREHMEAGARQVIEQRFALADTLAQWRDVYRNIAA
jgi:glycosyltransferase involved in cell wall biosynthesis